MWVHKHVHGLPVQRTRSSGVNGRFAAVVDPAALDMSVLGRDIFKWFALIVDQPGNTVCLIRQNHSYTVSPS